MPLESLSKNITTRNVISRILPSHNVALLITKSASTKANSRKKNWKGSPKTTTIQSRKQPGETNNSMWNNDDDVNDSGDPVELYLPIETVLRKSNIAPQDSHIGGLPSFDEYFIPPCDLCGDKMFLLAQLRLQMSSSEMERYLC